MQKKPRVVYPQLDLINVMYYPIPPDRPIVPSATYYKSIESLLLKESIE